MLMRKAGFVAVAAAMLAACAGGTHLRTEAVRDRGEVSGAFDLVLYMSPQYDFLETVAFFDVVGDGYELEPFEPDFEYRKLEGLDAKTALKEARHFVGHHRNFSGAHMRRITSDTGATIGYELKPVYQPFVYGTADVLEVDYFLKEGGRVKITIDVNERVKRMFENGDDSVVFGD